MDLQRLMSLTRKAIDDYSMIEEGDRIAIGVSGGKDSLAMLYALSGIRRFYPKHFELHAISVDLGFSEGEQAFIPIKALCERLNVPLTVVPSDIAEILFQIRKESNPCSLCAKLRKGALNTAAKELGCNKVAYAHHKDDMIETLLLSILNESRLYCFSPVTYLDRMDLTVIRPFMYVDEADIIGFKKAYELPVYQNPCPADGNTRREYAKNLVKQLTRETPGARERIFRAILKADLPGWPGRRVENPETSEV